MADENVQNQELDESGDNFVPTDDNVETGEPEAAGQVETQKGEAEEVAKPDIDPETLAAIAGEEKPKMVPHARFNEVNEEAKTYRARALALEEENARLKGQAPAAKPAEEEKPAPFDYDAAEEAYSAAVLDGDTTKARELRSQIRKQERADALAEAEAAADRRYAENKKRDDAARAKAEMELALNKVYVDFPFLDGASAVANGEAIDETLAMTNFYIGKGKSPADALAAAASRVGPRYTQPAAESAAKPAAEPKVDLQQALERERRVPAKPEGVGARVTKIDVSKMSSKDLKALSPEDEARLAGDVL
ncbi:hypothetical protein [Pseudomonas typographi]|uniref:hypothetical protein n=1 Tax=Pseudomonas typographi TaxID=2715964 RepID=UPI0016847639|nr:hypothetical protein [Pseudomonas typographi]MBD1554775.1 hypothetical protein [Pseudomonas typographi]